MFGYVGQELTAQRLTLAIAEECLESEPATARAKLAEMRELLGGMIRTVRTLIGDLRPWILHDLGFGEAAQWLARRTEEVAGLRCELAIAGDPAAVDPERSAAVFRILQESLTNVAKHAGATRISVLVTRKEQSVVVLVEDDGAGFDVNDPSSGLGLSGMRERVAVYGGEFEAGPRAEGGFRVRARLPLAGVH